MLRNPIFPQKPQIPLFPFQIRDIHLNLFLPSNHHSQSTSTSIPYPWDNTEKSTLTKNPPTLFIYYQSHLLNREDTSIIRPSHQRMGSIEAALIISIIHNHYPLLSNNHTTISYTRSIWKFNTLQVYHRLWNRWTYWRGRYCIFYIWYTGNPLRIWNLFQWNRFLSHWPCCRRLLSGIWRTCKWLPFLLEGKYWNRGKRNSLGKYVNVSTPTWNIKSLWICTR